MPIRFFTLQEILTLHSQQIQLYGGEPGVRDLGLLQSALAMPESSFGEEYLHPGIAEMAAAYLFHIVMNHPFIDGNKRTGTDAAVTFVFFNKQDLSVSSPDLLEFVWKVAAGEKGKDDVTEFFKRYLIPPAG